MLIGRRFAVFAVSLFKEEPGKGDLGIAEWRCLKQSLLSGGFRGGGLYYSTYQIG
jgi:hypothetical protein